MLKGNHSKLLVAWRPCPERKAQQRPSTSSVICLTEPNKLKLSIKNSVLSTTCDRPETPIPQIRATASLCHLKRDTGSQEKHKQHSRKMDNSQQASSILTMIIAPALSVLFTRSPEAQTLSASPSFNSAVHPHLSI